MRNARTKSSRPSLVGSALTSVVEVVLVGMFHNQNDTGKRSRESGVGSQETETRCGLGVDRMMVPRTWKIIS